MQMMVRDAYDKYGKIVRNQRKFHQQKTQIDLQQMLTLSAPSTPSLEILGIIARHVLKR